MVGIFNINFEPLTFCCVLFVSSILVLLNVTDINMCKVLILCECVTFVSDTFTRYRSNITNGWQEILTPMTLAFSGEVVREKLWKPVNIVKVTAKKSVAPFYVDTVYIIFQYCTDRGVLCSVALANETMFYFPYDSQCECDCHSHIHTHYGLPYTIIWQAIM